MMRDTVYTLSDDTDQEKIAESVKAMVKVQSYVPGYRLKQEVQFERFDPIIRCTFRVVAISRASSLPYSSR